MLICNGAEMLANTPSVRRRSFHRVFGYRKAGIQRRVLWSGKQERAVETLRTITSTDNPLLIFGKAALSQLAAHCIEQDGGRTVKAFVVDDEFLDVEACQGLPVVAFSNIVSRYPPDAHDFLVPIGFSQMNATRMDRCEQVTGMGYTLASYVSPSAQVWSGCQISQNVVIYENALIQPYAILGRNVIIRAGAIIGHHSYIEDHCFIASGVITGGHVMIGTRTFIGLGAIIRDGVKIAPRCFIGAGAVVLADTEPNGIYVGNPAIRSAQPAIEAT